MQRIRIYCLGLFLFACYHASAQTNSAEELVLKNNLNPNAPDTASHPGERLFTVRYIIIEGNRKTKPAIILREIPFKSGEKYLLNELVQQFETARRQLMNTSLFHEAIIALKSFEGYDIDILVHVKERWYVFPVPYFKPVDRNLNQWLVEQKGSLKRVNYGGKLLYNNFTGRNDKLKLWLIGGYTKQIQFAYDRMYIDRQLKWGMSLGFVTATNRELNYRSENDKQVFLREEKYLRSFTTASAELTYRKAIRTRHRFGIAYTRERVADTIIKLNPDYFRGGRSLVSYPRFYYIMSYFDLDFIPYPTKGYAAELTLQKEGINSAVNVWQVMAKGSAHWPTWNNAFFSLNTFATIKAPFRQPYYNKRLLGYSDIFMQGYEYYVVDGVAGAYVKTSLGQKIFNFNVKVPGTKKLAPQRIPFNIYGKLYGNTGYVYNPSPGDNYLANKMLYSWGMGIDITTIYDFALKVEWSFNQLGQNGIFIHKKVIF